jgi:hypothetical protein
MTRNPQGEPKVIFVQTGPWWSRIPVGYYVRVRREVAK